MVTTVEMNGSVPLMAEAAMNVIMRVYRPVDVMEVKIKDEDVNIYEDLTKPEIL